MLGRAVSLTTTGSTVLVAFNSVRTMTTSYGGGPVGTTPTRIVALRVRAVAWVGAPSASHHMPMLARRVVLDKQVNRLQQTPRYQANEIYVYTAMGKKFSANANRPALKMGSVKNGA